jgi:hypothetical protein
MNRNYITVAVVAVLCIAAFGYSKGWFSMSSSSPEIESTKVSTSQLLDEKEVGKDATQGAEVTKSPEHTAVK